MPEEIPCGTYQGQCASRTAAEAGQQQRSSFHSHYPPPQRKSSYRTGDWRAMSQSCRHLFALGWIKRHFCFLTRSSERSRSVTCLQLFQSASKLWIFSNMASLSSRLGKKEKRRSLATRFESCWCHWKKCSEDPLFTVAFWNFAWCLACSCNASRLRRVIGLFLFNYSFKSNPVFLSSILLYQGDFTKPSYISRVLCQLTMGKGTFPTNSGWLAFSLTYVILH